jgi:hypothetical protein
MKKESELKSRLTSLRMTEEQFQIAKATAESKNMSFSEYMVACAVHPDNMLTPEVMVQIQEIANAALRIARSKGDGYESQIQDEVDKLWLKLN